MEIDGTDLGERGEDVRRTGTARVWVYMAMWIQMK
jgi:hypothetical protein